MVKTLEEYDQAVQALLQEARTRVLRQLDQQLTVHEKTGRKDLVTNVDKSNEHFFVTGLRQLDPEAQILGEEGTGDKVTSLQGHVWIVDPIDGTMNFVHQRDNFAMMIGLYVDGQPTLGYIYDVIAGKLYAGGPKLGVTVNGAPLAAPKNLPLAEGLMGVSGPMLIRNRYQLQQIAEASLGARIIGSAGIEFIQVLTGKEVGYLSHLMPWDFAAGRVLAETLGLVVTKVDGSPVDMLQSDTVLVATKKAQQDILTFTK